MELNKIKIGDKFVFTGSLENFNLNEVYTISKIYKIVCIRFIKYFTLLKS